MSKQVLGNATVYLNGQEIGIASNVSITVEQDTHEIHTIRGERVAAPLGEKRTTLDVQIDDLEVGIYDEPRNPTIVDRKRRVRIRKH